MSQPIHSVSPLQVTGQRLRPGSGSSGPSVPSPVQHASPTPFFGGAPSSPLMVGGHQAPPSPMGSGGGGSYAHPSSPVSRFNSGILAINSSSAMTAGGSANIVTSPMAQGKFSVLRPTASRSGGLPFQHPLHSTAVQASHSVGQHAAQQKAAASNAQQAPNALPSSLRAAAAASSGGNGGSGSASPSAKKDRIGARKDSWGTFPRLGSAGGRVGSSGASPHSGSGSNSVTDQMASGSPAMRASPTGVGRSPEPAALGAAVLLTSAMLHPRPTTGTRDGRVGGMKVARTPPTTHKKRPHAERRNSDLDGAAIGGVEGELRHRLEDMDLGGGGGDDCSGYSSGDSADSNESHVSSFPAENYATAYYNGGNYDAVVEEELADVTAAAAARHTRFPPPSSPMQLRPGGTAPPPHKMMGIATPRGGPSATPTSAALRSRFGTLPGEIGSAGFGGGGYNSSADSSALQSPLFDSHSGPLPPHPSSTMAAARAPAPFPYAFPMSPIPPIESVSVFDTSALALAKRSSPHSASASGSALGALPPHHAHSHSHSAAAAHSHSHSVLQTPLTPLPQAALSGNGMALASPSPAPLPLTTIPALNLPSPHAACVDPAQLSASSSASSAASPRSAKGLGGVGAVPPVVPPFDPAHQKVFAQLQLQDLSSSSAFSSARSLVHSTSATSVGCGEDGGMDWVSTPTTRSLSSHGGGGGGSGGPGLYSHGNSNASSAASLHHPSLLMHDEINREANATMAQR